MARLGWIAAFVIGLAAATGAQDKPSSASPAVQSPPSTQNPVLIPRTHNERESEYRADHRIILNVLVTDAHGKPVPGLTANDFALLDDEQPHSIAAFRAVNGDSANSHAHVMLVLDAVNSSNRNLAVESGQIEKYLSRNRGRIKYPISLVQLSASGPSVDPPSQDADVLIGEVRQISRDLHSMGCGNQSGNPAQGDSGPGAYDAIGRVDALDSLSRVDSTVSPQMRGAQCLNRKFLISVSALEKLANDQENVPGRVILIWLGHGWPLLSEAGFRPDTAALRSRHFDYLAALSASLREAQVTLDAVSSPDLHRHAEPGVDTIVPVALPTEDTAGTADFALPVLARQTGGQVLQFADIASEIAASIADLESYYVLSFDTATTAASWPGKYHSLQVKVDQPGLKVRTNTAYFVRP